MSIDEFSSGKSILYPTGLVEILGIQALSDT